MRILGIPNLALWCGVFGTALALRALPGQAETLSVPSGYGLNQFDAFMEASSDTWRARYQAEGLTMESYAQVADDFVYLCEEMILPSLIANGQNPARIIITIADRQVPFGVTDPEAVQFFEAFRVQNTACIWEEF